MLESARKNLKIAAVDDSDRVPIPSDARAKNEHRNLLGFLSEIVDKGMCTMMTKHELLRSKFCRKSAYVGAVGWEGGGNT